MAFMSLVNVSFNCPGAARVRASVLWLTALILLPEATQAAAPLNKHLADSPWPVAHHDSFSQASTDHAGVSRKDVIAGRVEADYLFDPSVAGTLSVFWADWESSVAWGSSLRALYKIDTAATPMKIIDAIKKPHSLMSNDTFRGIYSVVSDEGVFYTSLGNLILAATHETGPDGSRDVQGRIRPLGSFILDRRLLGDEEGIISLNMLYSGSLAFLTNRGLIGVVSKNLKRVLALSSLVYSPKFLHHLPGLASSTPASLNDATGAAHPLAETASLFPVGLLDITNSMTVDHMNGLYIVSSHFMHKVVFDPVTEVLLVEWPRVRPKHPGVVVSSKGVPPEATRPPMRPWTRTYATEAVPNKYRLSRVGSGSSPTLFIHPANEQLYVTVTDGKYVQNLNVFDAVDGRLVGEAPVDFGVPGFKEESYTEQSVLVHEAEMVVVQNGLTATAKKLNAAFHHWDAANLLAEYNAPDRFSRNMWLAPVALGDAPRGVQKFALHVDPTNHSSVELRSVWATQEYGCPNSIPTMSQATGLMYCVSKAARSRITDFSWIRDAAAKGVISNRLPGGKQPSPETIKSLGGRASPVLPYPDGFEGTWTIAGIDWLTGQKLFDVRTGSDLRFNSLYAAVQIGPRRQIIYGSLGGIVRVKPIPAEGSLEQ